MGVYVVKFLKVKTSSTPFGICVHSTGACFNINLIFAGALSVALRCPLGRCAVDRVGLLLFVPMPRVAGKTL